MVAHYTILSSLFVVLFAFLYVWTYFLWNSVLFANKKSAFQQLDKAKKLDYIARVTSSLHAIIVTVTSTIGCFYMCDDTSKTIFTSMQCLNTPKIYHAYTTQITTGYLTFDFILSVCVLKDFSSLGMQTLFHHVTAGGGFFLASIIDHQSAYLILCLANQHTEISAPFMHLRQLLYIHKDIAYHSIIENVNIFFFFTTFLFGRFIFQLRLAYIFFFFI